jgi:hypothetical protein
MKIFTGTTVQAEQTVTTVISGSENQLPRWFKECYLKLTLAFLLITITKLPIL